MLEQSEKHLTVKLALSALPGGMYRSRIEDSPVGASKGSGNDFQLPDAPTKGYAQFLREVTSGNQGQDALQELGKVLFDRVFKGNVGSKFNEARAVAREQGAYLRLAISALAPELIQVPWEFLHDDSNYLIKHPKTHIIRVLDSLPPQMAPFRPFRRLLLAVANPRGPQQFDSDDHVQNISKALVGIGASFVLVKPATRASLMQALEGEEFDAFYFLGHGELDVADGGRIVLEDKNGGPDYLPASTLAEWLSNSPNTVYFAYFNSCDSGDTSLKDTFSGVAQRILSDGTIPAVVGQQAPALADQSQNIAEAVLRKVCHGSSPEAAMAYARSVAENATWGIPVLYTHLRGADEFERNRLECLLEADRNTKFVLSLPTFRMGLRIEDYLEKKARVTIDPPDWYRYPGDAHPRTAIMAAIDVIGLLTKIVPEEQIKIVPSNTETDGTETHQFLFGGTISNVRVGGVLGAHSTNFRLALGDGPEWAVIDKQNKRRYAVSNFSRLEHGKYDSLKDYGIIEKIVQKESHRVFFVIAGLGSRATLGCARYLVDNWSTILEQHVQGGFGIVLEFPGNMEYYDGRQVDPSKDGNLATVEDLNEPS